jgi:hypothetical protein
MRKVNLPAAIAGAIVTGGTAALLLISSGVVTAASPTASAQPVTAAAATATTPVQPTAQASASAPTSTASGRPSGHGPFGRNEAVSDASIVAKVIGITEAQLDTALASGQTVAQIAKAHNVDPQKVIDALVTDGLNELAAEVKAGTITQAQADAQKAAVTQRATDQVNGTFSGPGGANCPR